MLVVSSYQTFKQVSIDTSVIIPANNIIAKLEKRAAVGTSIQSFDGSIEIIVVNNNL